MSYSIIFPDGASGKEPACQCRRHKRCRFDPRGWEDPLEESMTTHSSGFLPRKSYGQRGLADYSP